MEAGPGPWGEPEEEVLARLGKGRGDVTYGFTGVEKAINYGAVDKLLVADIKLRETTDEQRRVLENVMKKVEEAGYLDTYLEELLAKKCDPYTLSEKILSHVITEYIPTSHDNKQSIDQSNAQQKKEDIKLSGDKY